MNHNKRLAKYLNFIVCLMLAIFMSGCSKLYLRSVSDQRIDELIAERVEAAGLSLVKYLESEQYGLVIELLENKYQKMVSDVAFEDEFVFEFNYLLSYQGELSSKVERLVKSYPDSPFSYLVRAGYLSSEASRARGGKWIHQTSDKRIENMLRLQDKAIADYERSIELLGANYYAYMNLGAIYGMRKADSAKSYYYFRKSLMIQPASYWVWAEILQFSQPRWGGSYVLMNSYIQELEPYIKINPKLSVLQNSVFLDKASMADLNGDHRKALLYYDKASQYGNDHRVLYRVGNNFNDRGRYDVGCPKILQALRLRPYMRAYNEGMVACQE